MLFKKILSSFFLLGCCHLLFAQQVNLQSGSLSYTVPVFDYADPKSGLATSVALVYNSKNGVFVNEVASNIGLGWQLSCGGVIERTQRGLPDDQYCAYTPSVNPEYQIIEREYQQDYDNYYPNGYLYTSIAPDNVPKELAIVPRFTASQSNRYKQSVRSSEDREADLFNINLNGRFVSFVIGKDKTVKVLSMSKLKVTFTEADLTSQKIRTRINQFTITDENGMVYYFNNLGVSEINRTVELERGSEETPYSFNNTEGIDKYVVDKWYLSEILNPQTQQKILFAYAGKTLSYKLCNDINSNFYTVERTCTTTDPNTGQDVTVACTDYRHDVSVTYVNSKIKALDIDQITMPDGHLVKFIYRSDVARKDLAGANPVEKIQVLYEGMEIKSIVLLHGYFKKKEIIGYTTATTDLKYLRLCLQKISMYGINGAAAIETGFEYYTGSNDNDARAMVPARYSLAQDHWGYYNGSTWCNDDNEVTEANNFAALRQSFAETNINTYRAVKDNYAAYGLLKNILLPSGGKSTVHYAQNETPLSITERKAGGVHVLKLEFFDAGVMQPAMVKKYLYTGPGGSSLWTYEAPEYYVNKQHRFRATIPAHNKTGVLENNIKSSDERSFSFLLTASEQLTTRVASVLLNNICNGTRQKGELFAAFFNTSMSYVIGLIVDKFNHNLTEKWSPSQLSNYSPFNFSNSLGTFFSRVEVVDEGIANGKTIYEYTTPAYYGQIPLPNQFPYSARSRYDEWKVNLPLSVTAINSNNQVVKKSEYEYSFLTEATNSNYKSVKFDVVKSFSNRYDWFQYNIDEIGADYLVSEEYYPKPGMALLQKAHETSYDLANGISTTLTQQNTYNSINNLPASSFTTDSRGNTIGSNTYYVTDYSLTGAIQQLKDLNAINTPVASMNWIQEPGGQKKMLSTSITQYGQLPTGEIKPIAVYGNRVQNLPETNLANNFSGSNLLSYPDVEELVNNVYDANSNLVQMNLKDGIVKSFVYSYNKQYLVATAENAAADKIAYTSFETDEHHNWTLHGMYASSSDYFMTGDRCFKFTAPGQSITSNICGGEAFVLSFWSRTRITVNGGLLQPVINAPSINGWTYYQYNVAPNVSTITLTGMGYLDELRLYPAKASMSTVTWNPVFGKTSACDINNRIVYYQYDELGRLKTERNEQFDIIKAYDYKFANQ